jgi:hypothetical protein
MAANAVMCCVVINYTQAIECLQHNTCLHLLPSVHKTKDYGTGGSFYFLFIYFIDKLHATSGTWTHDLTLHLATNKGNTILAKAHW